MKTVISALVSFVIRLLLTVATVILVVSLMAVALVTMLGLIVWSLIRGRKPTIDVSGFARARGKFRPGANRAGGTMGAMGDVVDVEAREVPNAPAVTPRLDP